MEEWVRMEELVRMEVDASELKNLCVLILPFNTA